MELEQEFLRLCREWADRPDVFHTEVIHEKNLAAFSALFRVIRVELVYSRKWETVAPPSVLYCRVYLSKNDPVYLHLPELLSYLDTGDYRACYFPCIESAQRMEDCFRALTRIVDDHIPAAQQLASTDRGREVMERWAEGGFSEDPEGKEESQDGPIDWDTMLWARKLQESFMVSRHTTLDAYEAFLNGDREKAIEKYEKMRKNGLSIYEKGLLEFLRSEAAQDFSPMPPECYAYGAYKKTAKGDKTDLKGLFLLYAGFAVLFCGLLAVINGFLARDTLYFYGIEWWFGGVLAVVPALFGYFAFQKKLRSLLGGGNEFLDAAKSSRFAARLAAVAFTVAMAGCIWFCATVPGMSFRMYDDYAVYYSEEETLKQFAYAQVEEIYCISARYNSYGDRVERASCVLILEDGRQVDLDCNGSVEEQLAVVRQLFPELEILELDSDRDLP